MTTVARPGRRQAGPPPEDGYVRELVSEAQSEDSALIERWRFIRDVRGRRHDIVIPEAYRVSGVRPYYSHWGEEIVRRVVAHTTRNMPQVRVPPLRSSAAAQANSTKREKWSTALLTQTDRESAPDRWFRVVMDHASTYGLGILKAIWLSQRWPDYPVAESHLGKPLLDSTSEERRRLGEAQDTYTRDKLPFWIGSVDPQTWHGFYSDRQLVECVEVSQRSVSHVLRRHPELTFADENETFRAGLGRARPPESGQIGQRSVRWTEHWDSHWVTYLANERVVEQFRHGYRRVPYYPFYGTMDASRDVGQRPISILDHVADLIVLYDTLMTYATQVAFMAAFPMGILEQLDRSASPIGADGVVAGVLPDGVGDRQQGPLFTFEPGKFVLAPHGYKAGWMQFPPSGPDLARTIQEIRNTLDGVIPSLMRGIGEPGQPGYAIRQLMDAFKVVLDPMTENCSLALELLVPDLWWIVENVIRVPVPVLADAARGHGRKSWLTLSPDDIAGYYVCSVSISPYLPNNKIGQQQQGLQEVQAGAKSMKRHQEEDLDIEAPEEELAQIWVEQELNDKQSPLRAKLRERALREFDEWLGSEEARKAARTAGVQLPPGLEASLGMDAAAQGPQGPPGPGGPLVPEPGLGMPLEQPVPGGPAGVPAGLGPPGPAPAGPGPAMPPGPPSGFPGAGGPSGMPGGRAAGEGRLPPMGQ